MSSHWITGEGVEREPGVLWCAPEKAVRLPKSCFGPSKQWVLSFAFMLSSINLEPLWLYCPCCVNFLDLDSRALHSKSSFTGEELHSSKSSRESHGPWSTARRRAWRKEDQSIFARSRFGAGRAVRLGRRYFCSKDAGLAVVGCGRIADGGDA